MSKLAEQMAAVLTPKKGRIVQPYNINMLAEYEYDRSNLCTEVRFTATFGTKHFIQEPITDYLLNAVLRDIKCGVVQEVFGEFRPTIHKLRHALLNREYNEALDTLDDLEKNMFHV